jgi:hypothetical protein
VAVCQIDPLIIYFISEFISTFSYFVVVNHLCNDHIVDIKVGDIVHNCGFTFALGVWVYCQFPARVNGETKLGDIGRNQLPLDLKLLLAHAIHGSNVKTQFV